LLGLRLDLDRQREREYRALADLRLDPELAPVHFDDAPRDRKTQAGAALLLGGGIVGLLEFLKNLALICLLIWFQKISSALTELLCSPGVYAWVYDFIEPE